MLLASAKAVAVAVFLVLILAGCLAAGLAIWILLPEARPHLRLLAGNGRRLALKGFGK